MSSNCFFIVPCCEAFNVITMEAKIKIKHEKKTVFIEKNYEYFDFFCIFAVRNQTHKDYDHR